MYRDKTMKKQGKSHPMENDQTQFNVLDSKRMELLKELKDHQNEKLSISTPADQKNYMQNHR
jgi:glutathionylspermidine synthase